MRSVSLAEPELPDRPGWGGLVIDEKGDWTQVVAEVLANAGRTPPLVLGIQDDSHSPRLRRLNLIDQASFTPTALARAIVRAGQAVSGSEGEQAFFRTQAQARLSEAIELLRTLRRVQESLPNAPVPTIPSARLLLDVLTRRACLMELLEPVGPAAVSPQRSALENCCRILQERHWSLPPETLGGVQATLSNYLAFLCPDTMHDVFGTASDARIEDMDHGLVFCLDLPQSLALERRAAAALLKQLWYQHARQRFNRPSPAQGRNLLILWQDEAQRFIQSEDGDVDILRGADATTILACQSKVSLHPPLGGRERAEPILLNLRNRVAFRAADETCAKETSDFIGNRTTRRRTITEGRGGTSRSFATEETHRVKPHILRSLPDFTAVVITAAGTWRALSFSPVLPDGTRPGWWRARRPWRHRWRAWLGFAPDILSVSLTSSVE
jgi:hypothetical protein